MIGCPVRLAPMTIASPPDSIPWKESAVCVRRPQGGDAAEREIVVQGSLLNVVQVIGTTDFGPMSALLISLPDRGAAPFRYTGYEILELLRELPFSGK